MDTILVVDDERNYLLVMSELLKGQGYDVVTAENGREAIDFVFEEDGAVDLVLTDMKMPKMDGIELLSKIKEIRPELPVILMTAHGTVELAVEAMKDGAYDYITKPFDNDKMLQQIRRALEKVKLIRDNRRLQQENEDLKESRGYASIIGESTPMQAVFELIKKVASTRATVLVTGESGTGKELIAKAIHKKSPRADKPFIAVNCSALAESLLESELFGHERGAFTDAKSMRKGRFELAQGGTIFLDEIGEMAPGLQAKLLRVLQERQFERVGGTTTFDVDVRVIAATNRDLKQEVADNRFREDLFYRLNVLRIHMPPLRERKGDLPMLVGHFIRKYGRDMEKPDMSVSPDALKLLEAYDWPGNVRELENTMERAVILCAGKVIQPEDLPEEIARFLPAAKPAPVTPAPDPPGEPAPREPDPPEKAAPPAAPPARTAPANGVIAIEGFVSPEDGLNLVIDTLRKRMIARALERGENVKKRAAEMLGIKPNNLDYWLKQYPSEALEAPTGLDLDLDALVPEGMGLNEALESVERQLLFMALEMSGQVQTQAAALLGIDKKAMYYKLKKYKLI